MNKKPYLKSISGFSIIETIIAIGIFLIVVIFGTTSLLNAYMVNRKSENMRSILDSLSFVMEDMSKNIRTGYNYFCLENGSFKNALIEEPNSCIGGLGIAFESSEGEVGDPSDQWLYYFSGSKLFKSTSGPDQSIQMTPDEVIIDTTKSSFSIYGAEGPDEGDFQQPLVTIHLIGNIISKGNTTPFNLQTSLSQRTSDL